MASLTFYGAILANSRSDNFREKMKVVDSIVARFFPKEWKELQHENGPDNDFWADIGSNGDAVIPGTNYTIQEIEGTFILYSYLLDNPASLVEIKPPTDQEKQDFLSFLEQEQIPYEKVGLFNIAIY